MEPYRPIPLSTYCSDPAACFVVSSVGPYSSGIDGYYTNEFDAYRAKAGLKKLAHKRIKVEPYDPGGPVKAGLHPLVRLFLNK